MRMLQVTLLLVFAGTKCIMGSMYPPCQTNADCKNDELCDRKWCMRLCNHAVCGQKAICHVNNHILNCTCQPGHHGDPFTECIDPDTTPCKTDNDCTDHRFCSEGYCEDACSSECGNNFCYVKDHIATCFCDPWQRVLKLGCYEQFGFRWPPYRGEAKQYKVEEIKVNWTMAATLCLRRQGRLASLSSSLENDMAKTVIANSAGDHHMFWTSGTNGFQQNQWSWASTKLPLNFTNWSPGQPKVSSVPGVEQCLELQTFGWNAADCEELKYPLCEYYKVPKRTMWKHLKNNVVKNHMGYL
uniref:C-type lectin domain-containing protein n=1 Tax=Graphocephala atropunctata TaxID=36148 RepID=A0A1B6L097_9HEMI